MNDLRELALSSALMSGQRILSLYGKSPDVDLKNDGSPVTDADRELHEMINGILASSGIPVVSEECCDPCLEARLYWLVDPLDGTKDFLARNGKFTVNIALIDDCIPVLGIVYAPAIDILYCGQHGQTAWMKHNGAYCELRQ